VSNSWTMPIRGRIDMLTTGIRTPVGIKILGPKLEPIEKIGADIENAVRGVSGTRNVFAERILGGFYMDFDIDRPQVARYGLTVGEVEDVIETAIGGMNVTRTIEGRERFPVNVRYARELRTDFQTLDRVLVAGPNGSQIPLAQLTKIRVTPGPPLVRSEAGELAGYVYVDVAGRDLGSYV